MSVAIYNTATWSPADTGVDNSVIFWQLSLSDACWRQGVHMENGNFLVRLLHSSYKVSDLIGADSQCGEGVETI